jgi:hypothetical protein
MRGAAGRVIPVMFISNEFSGGITNTCLDRRIERTIRGRRRVSRWGDAGQLPTQELVIRFLIKQMKGSEASNLCRCKTFLQN